MKSGQHENLIESQSAHNSDFRTTALTGSLITPSCGLVVSVNDVERMARQAAQSVRKSEQPDKGFHLKKKDKIQKSQANEPISADLDFELPISDDEQLPSLTDRSKPLSKSNSISLQARVRKTSTNTSGKRNLSGAEKSKDEGLVRDGTRRSQRSVATKRRNYEDISELDDYDLLEADDIQTQPRKATRKKRCKMTSSGRRYEGLGAADDGARICKSFSPKRHPPINTLTAVINTPVEKDGNRKRNINQDDLDQKSDQERRAVVTNIDIHGSSEIRVGTASKYGIDIVNSSISNDDGVAEDSHPQVEHEPHLDKQEADLSFGTKLLEHIQTGFKSDVTDPNVTTTVAITSRDRSQQISKPVGTSGAGDEHGLSPLRVSGKGRSVSKRRENQDDDQIRLGPSTPTIQGPSVKRKRIEKSECYNADIGPKSKSIDPLHHQNHDDLRGKMAGNEFRTTKRSKILGDQERSSSVTNQKEQIVHFDRSGPRNQGMASPEKKKRQSLPTTTTFNKSPSAIRTKRHSSINPRISDTTGGTQQKPQTNAGTAEKDNHLAALSHALFVDVGRTHEYPDTSTESNLVCNVRAEDVECQTLREKTATIIPGNEIATICASEQAPRSNEHDSKISTKAYKKLVDKEQTDGSEKTSSAEENSDEDSIYVASREESTTGFSPKQRRRANVVARDGNASERKHIKMSKSASNSIIRQMSLPLLPSNPKILKQSPSGRTFDLIEITNRQFLQAKTQIDLKCFKAQKDSEFEGLTTSFGQSSLNILPSRRKELPRGDMHQQKSKERSLITLTDRKNVDKFPTYVKRHSDCDNWTKDTTLAPSSTPLSFGLQMDQKLREWQAREVTPIEPDKENEEFGTSVYQGAETTLIENIAVRYAPPCDSLHWLSNEDVSGSRDASPTSVYVQRALPVERKQNGHPTSTVSQHQQLQVAMTNICMNLIVRLSNEEKSIEEKTSRYVQGIVHVRGSFERACEDRLTYQTSKIKDTLEGRRGMLRRLLETFEGSNHSGTTSARTDSLVDPIAQHKNAILSRLATFHHVE